MEFVPKTSTEGDHSANGLAEIGVREIKCQVRVIRSQLERNLKARLEETEPILAWIPRHAANKMHRYCILDDGHTPEERHTGKNWKRAIVSFGEKVFYRPIACGGGAKNDAEMRMRPGIFLGHHERTGTHILLTPDGVERGGGLHPLPEDKRWDLEFLKTCKGLPWEMRPGKRLTPQPMFGEEEREHAVPIVIPNVPVATPLQRNWYVTTSDIDKYGGTDGCRSCTAIALGGRVDIPHDATCRPRIFKCYADDPDPRQQARYKRYNERHHLSYDAKPEVEPEVPDLDGPSTGREVPDPDGPSTGFEVPDPDGPSTGREVPDPVGPSTGSRKPVIEGPQEPYPRTMPSESVRVVLWGPFVKCSSWYGAPIFRTVPSKFVRAVL